MFWWNYFCNNYTDYYKNICSKVLFCNDFGQDGIVVGVSKQRSTPTPWAQGLRDQIQKEGAPETENPSCIGFSSGQRGTEAMVSDHGLGRGQTKA